MAGHRPFSRDPADAADARKPYDLIAEPVGEDYVALLRAARGQCSSGVLTLPAAEAGGALQVVVDALRIATIGELETGGGLSLRFHFNEETLAVLTTAVDRLYDWRLPDRPENLVLLRRDGTPWLMTVSHARAGHLELSAIERLLLARESPRLPGLVVPRADRDAILAVFEQRVEAGDLALARDLETHALGRLDEARPGLVAALGVWLESGDRQRVDAALAVIVALGIDELIEDAARVAGSDAPVPPAPLTLVPPLQQRWLSHRRQLFTAVARMAPPALDDQVEAPAPEDRA